MEITQGKYKIKFVANLPAWRTYYNGRLVASTNESMWENQNLNFKSREAGEALLYTTIELFAGMEAAAEIEDKEGSMFKTDEGQVENDKPTADPKVQSMPDFENKEENLAEEPAEKVIIIKIKNLVDDAQTAKDSGLDASPIIAQIEDWGKKYVEAVKIARLLTIDALYEEAEKALEAGIDCSATLDKIASLVDEVHTLG